MTIMDDKFICIFQDLSKTKRKRYKSFVGYRLELSEERYLFVYFFCQGWKNGIQVTGTARKRLFRLDNGTSGVRHNVFHENFDLA